MRYRIESAMAEFDRWSRNYDRCILQRLFFGPSHAMMIDKLRPGDLRILDIGCGTGLFAERILRHDPDARVWGLDLSTRMLARSALRQQRWNGRYQLVRGDSERLPFRDGFFDVITCSHSFHHYPRQAQVVGEMHRVLRPGGQLMIVDGDRDGFWGRFVFDLVVRIAEGPVHHCSARRFRELYRRAGFQEIEQQHRGGALPFVLTIGQADKAAAARRLAA